jgi:hypothetical protein
MGFPAFDGREDDSPIEQSNQRRSHHHASDVAASLTPMPYASLTLGVALGKKATTSMIMAFRDSLNDFNLN